MLDFVCHTFTQSFQSNLSLLKSWNITLTLAATGAMKPRGSWKDALTFKIFPFVV